MKAVSGIGKVGRKRLAEVIRRTKGTISVAEAAGILEIDAASAAKMLALWASKGWLSRVRRGLYIPVALESRTADVILEDPWLVADRLFTPCYIGGWSAAEHWSLTEQIFRTLLVMTTLKPRDRNPVIKSTNFRLRTVSKRAMFGLKPVWRGQVKVSVSDPTRTVIDLLSDPGLGGGLRPTADVFLNYLRSDRKNLDLLVEYAARLGNGAVFKRLGFMMERLVPEEKNVILTCLSRITKGNSKLDPALPADRLVTRWRLWVPEHWAKEGSID